MKVKTMKEWGLLGYDVIQGSRAVEWMAGVPLFSEDQVVEHKAFEEVHESEKELDFNV